MSPVASSGARAPERSQDAETMAVKLELRTFPSTFSPYEEIHVHADDFGSRLRAGDLVEVFHPSREDGKMRLLLIVSCL